MKLIAFLASIASVSAFAPNPAFSRMSTSVSAFSDDQFATLKEIIVDNLDLDDDSKVTKEASFIDDLDADSLDVVEMVMAIEEAYEVEIEDDKAAEIKTVGDVCDFLEANSS
mmetsp:Transcript_9522/g.14714  ORF Transcript_9522/g.14714 Transcript_9522/m.14714 type:complete len:112 (-) Transcript_9522:215-550(-)